MYNMVTYGLKDGLPEERLNCLMQDKDGYIWIGARFGLYKFNGKKFSTVPLPSSVRNRFVNYIFQDAENRIWVCLNGGGLIVFEKNTCTQFLIQQENTDLDFAEMNSATVNSVNRIYEIKRNLFFVLTDQGSFLFDGKRFTPFAPFLLDGSPRGFPTCFRAVVIADTLWLQTSYRLYLFKTQEFHHPQLLAKYDSGGWPICLQGRNTLVLGHTKGLKYRDASDNYQAEHDLFLFPQPNAINNLFAQGNYTWASTNDGIFLFNAGKLTMHLTPHNGLPSSLVKDILKDRSKIIGWQPTEDLYCLTIQQTKHSCTQMIEALL